MNPKQFLNKVFGCKSENEYVNIWTMPHKHSNFFKDINHAAGYIEKIKDRQYDIYVQCGLLSKDLGRKKRGKKTDIAGITALYMDVDFCGGPAHEKKDLPPTPKDALALVKGHGIDPTMIINSGHGFHAWWLLKKPWLFETDKDRDAAEMLNKRLQTTIQARAKEKGWELDSTYDLARVLRIAGTFNRKDSEHPIEVTLFDNTGICYDPSDFDQWLISGDQIINSSFPSSQDKQNINSSLVIDPQAEPPAEKLQKLFEIDPRVRISWNGQRSFIKKNSPSEHAMSLTSFAVQAGWPDQEIADLIIAFYRKNVNNPHFPDISFNKALRPDFIRKTIDKVRFSQKRQHGDVIDAFYKNEDGDADLYIKSHRGEFVLDRAAGQWYVWRDHYWLKDILDESLCGVDAVIEEYEAETERIRKLIDTAKENANEDLAKKYEKLKKSLQKRIFSLRGRDRKKRVLELSSIGKNGLGICGHEWDRQPLLLPCKNGVVDLRTGQLSAGRPDQFLKTVCPTSFNPSAHSPQRFLSFLDDICDGDQDQIDYILNLLGSSLIGEVRDHVFPIFYGKNGRNGKATLVELTADILGPLAGPISPELLLKQKFAKNPGSPSPEIMALCGKRLVWASEPDDKRRFNISRVKLLVGGDTLHGRAPYGRHEVDFKPSHTLILLTNYKPEAPAEDNAFWQRVHLVEFKNSFIDTPAPGNPHQKKAIKGLGKILIEEAEGILILLVGRCIQYQKCGFLKPPAGIVAKTKEYRDDQDNLGKYVADRSLNVEGKKTYVQPMYDDYCRYCDRNDLDKMSIKDFSQAMADKFGKGRDSKGNYFRDIVLKASASDTSLRLVSK